MLLFRILKQIIELKKAVLFPGTARAVSGIFV